MEKKEIIETDNLIPYRLQDIESKYIPRYYCFRPLSDSIISLSEGNAEITIEDIEVMVEGQPVKEEHYIFSISIHVGIDIYTVFEKDMGRVEDGLPNEDEIDNLLKVAAQLIKRFNTEVGGSTIRNAIIDRMGFPFNVAVNKSNQSNVDTYYVVNRNLDVISETKSLIQAEIIRDALNLFNNSNLFESTYIY